MPAEVVCPHCGLQYETREMVSVNGFYGCTECFNEHSSSRSTGKQIRRRPERRSWQLDMARRSSYSDD